MYELSMNVANPLAVMGIGTGMVVGMAVLTAYVHTYVRTRMTRA